jgi:hypothetical protein
MDVPLFSGGANLPFHASRLNGPCAFALHIGVLGVPHFGKAGNEVAIRD